MKPTIVVVPVALVFFVACGGVESERQFGHGKQLLGDTLPTETLTQVTIDCGDGYPTVATVDAATLTTIQDAVQSIVDNPSGMVCILSTSPAPIDASPSPVALKMVSTSSAASTAKGNPPFVVGGGRYVSPFNGCIINFGLSGHMDKDGSFHGTQTVSSGAGNQPSPACQGEVKADVRCLSVDTATGKVSRVEGIVTHATGIFASGSPPFFTPNVTPLRTITDDGGQPSGGTSPDHIRQDRDANGCFVDNVQRQQLINGNININI
jgi:hypothetical protein